MGSLINSGYGVFIVADGLGGHQAGEKASQYLCEEFLKLTENFLAHIEQNPSKGMELWIDQAIDAMKIRFADYQYADDAHTTCAILYLDAKRVITAHCGDTRVYRLNQDGIIWRTKDHSLIQKLVDDGEISEQEMGTHPHQNRLTRSINISKPFSVEVKQYPIAIPGETFLLCTDGFWEFIKQNELIELAQGEVKDGELIKKARLSMLRAGDKGDNISVQWVRVD